MKVGWADKQEGNALRSCSLGKYFEYPEVGELELRPEFMNREVKEKPRYLFS
jgi:hypothetical protein